MTYQELITKIKNKEKFDFSRFGDGEFNAIFRDKPSTQNCDGHSYFPDMGDRLRKILESNPDYYLGLQNMAYKQRKEQIDAFNVDWCKSDILHYQSIKRGLKTFYDALNTRDVLMVGPKHLQNLYPKYLHGQYLVTVPDKNCWLQYEAVLLEINALLPLKDWVICYSASMMSNVLIDDFAGKATQIDCGSVFDPYCGVNSRSYMKNLKI